MKTLRHLFTALLLLCCTVANAHDFEVNGIYYNILSEEDKTVEVTYRGRDYYDYFDVYSGDVTIPANVTYKGTTYSVTTIGYNAFGSSINLTSITIPNSVTTIGGQAFSRCSSLTSIEIPNSVTTIGNYAFSYCSRLTSITIPNSVTTIGEYAFSSCIRLTSIEIPNSVTAIESPVFSDCTSLASISVAAGNTTYDSRDNCNAIIETTTNTLIASCKNTVIPNSVTTIGESAFYACSNLTSIEIPNSVTTIGSYAFHYCTSLTSIVIPNSVTAIGNSVFSACTRLASISVAAGNTTYDCRDNCNAIIETTTNTLIAGCQNTVIPNSVTTIGDYAFYRCNRLISIVIPSSVTTIGVQAFRDCSLASIEIPNSVTTIGDYAFSECSRLTSITIPNSVTTIGYYAFSIRSLTSITSLIPADKLFAPRIYAFSEVDKNTCTLYVPYGAKERYAATEGWNEFTNIVEIPAESFDLTVSAAKYATLYLDYNAIIPAGVEVYTASTVDGNRLMMELVTDVLPANTAVIVKAEQGTYTFAQSDEEVAAIENNLLRGSVEDEYITPEKNAKYYVLAMKDGVVGMYEDALSGGTFKNNAHKAYLVLKANIGIYDEEVNTQNPGAQLSNSYYFDFSGTTAIDPVVTEINDNIYYDLSGRRVENPTRGIYIVNGKKVFIK